MQRTAFFSPLFVAAAVAVGFLALLLPKISSGMLSHNDEILTAERAREMLVRGDPWAVTLNWQPDFKKPPLQYWASALLLRWRPLAREWAVRLPSTVYAALCLPRIIDAMCALSRNRPA